MILAYDPGNEYTAYCLIDDNRRPIEFGKVLNEDALRYLYGRFDEETKLESVVIEMVASYGMAVGRSVFETCVMIGRLTEAAKTIGAPVDYIYRFLNHAARSDQ